MRSSLSQPVRARISHPRAGRIRSSPGRPAESSYFYATPGAMFPGSIWPGDPLSVLLSPGPPFYPAYSPIRAPIPMRPKGGRIGSNPGAPVRNPGGVFGFSLGIPYLQWKTGGAYVQWQASYTTTGISQLALEYVFIPVSVTKAGVAYNPTGDNVQFAFMPTATQVPQYDDWQQGAWDAVPSNILYPYSAKCLVGPGGITNPGIGTYVMYLKVTDNPEIPVLIGGQLQIS